MSRLFLSQKRIKQFNRSYSSIGEGAMRTKSSAKASKNNYREAIVYFQFNSIKVNPSISTKEPDGDSTPHAYNSHTTIIQQVKEPADILYQIHR